MYLYSYKRKNWSSTDVDMYIYSHTRINTYKDFIQWVCHLLLDSNAKSKNTLRLLKKFMQIQCSINCDQRRRTCFLEFQSEVPRRESEVPNFFYYVAYLNERTKREGVDCGFNQRLDYKGKQASVSPQGSYATSNAVKYSTARKILPVAARFYKHMTIVCMELWSQQANDYDAHHHGKLSIDLCMYQSAVCANCNLEEIHWLHCTISTKATIWNCERSLILHEIKSWKVLKIPASEGHGAEYWKHFLKNTIVFFLRKQLSIKNVWTPHRVWGSWRV